MRCIACDKLLNDFEATRKFHNTDEYVDLCNDCMYYVDIVPDDRLDLLHEADIGDDDGESERLADEP